MNSHTLRKSIVAALAATGLALGSAPAATAATTVNLMTLNVYLRGTGDPAPDSAGAVAATIRAHNSKIVALQETSSAFTAAVAAKLGWSHVTHGDVAVISASTQTSTDRLTASGAPVVGGQIGGVWYYSTHLSHHPYGPYLFCDDGAPAATVTAQMQSQVDQAIAIENWARTPKAQILMGDFNSPSGLDWVASARAHNCGTVYDWQTLRTFYAAGWQDTFRVANPNPATTPGDSWSAKPSNSGDPQDRIDYILTKSGSSASAAVRTSSSAMIGNWSDPDWISDHYGFVSTITIG
ncbi:endonuclease/exonuclease/phosphatase family protein [Lentzea sp. NPDC058450]|uniref:endonuclease/exonuclease/phosphatase family protein n=1 Tax=Lentzea sp. NPDC058450 TaxID=3346505 RepID=UPI0036495DB8